MTDLWLKESDGWTQFKCRVSPQSSRTALSGYYADAVKINIKAPPVDGKANEELIRFISKSIKLSKAYIIIVSGETSKTKTIKCKTDKATIENFIKKTNANGEKQK